MEMRWNLSTVRLCFGGSGELEALNPRNVNHLKDFHLNETVSRTLDNNINIFPP